MPLKLVDDFHGTQAKCLATVKQPLSEPHLAALGGALTALRRSAALCYCASD